MADPSTALVVGASEEELDYVKGCLSDWECVPAPRNGRESGASVVPATPKLIIVHARKEWESTQAICQQARKASGSSAPILLVIGRYEISQGSAIKEMGNAAFIIAPFHEKELRDKIGELLESAEG